jgi:hypothetical protein
VASHRRETKDIRLLIRYLSHAIVRTWNSRPTANAGGRDWQYTTRARVRSCPTEELRATTLPASQGRSLRMRAPFELMFSVHAYSACGGFCSFETRTRNFWSSRPSRRPVNSAVLIGLVIRQEEGWGLPIRWGNLP